MSTVDDVHQPASPEQGALRRESHQERRSSFRDRREARFRGRLADANFAGATYGQILVLSVLAALGTHTDDALTVAITVAGSQLVFWLAHAYAEFTALQVRSGEGFEMRDLTDVLEHEWPLVQAAIPTVILMALAGLDALEPATGVDVAIGLSVAQLLGWGLFVGRRSGRGPIGQVTVAILSGMFGLLIVALKLATH